MAKGSGAIGAAAAVLLGVPMVFALAMSGGEPAPDCGPTPAELAAEPLDNARVIVRVGEELGVPSQGRIIALATALVESELDNVNYGLDDSLGLFQQRPSQGWGTAEQVQDPVYAATAFYARLLATPGWLVRQPGDVAQSIQRSAYPGRYAERMAEATAIHESVRSTGPGGPAAVPVNSAANCTPAGGDLVDVAAPHGPPIRVDSSIAPSLAALLAVAADEGVILGGSGWRSTQRQTELRLINGCPDTYSAPASSCRVPTARPGSSLHETGLAVDFTCNGRGTVRRGDPCDRWLLANAGAFGLRNLKSESWHYWRPSGN